VRRVLLEIRRCSKAEKGQNGARAQSPLAYLGDVGGKHKFLGIIPFLDMLHNFFIMGSIEDFIMNFLNEGNYVAGCC